MTAYSQKEPRDMNAGLLLENGGELKSLMTWKEKSVFLSEAATVMDVKKWILLPML